MTVTPTLRIGDREIGPGRPTYIVAEMSGNHNGRFEEAVQILGAAKEAGADAVKLQTYTADTLTLDCDSPLFRIEGTLWGGRKLYELYREAATPWEWQPKLKRIADEIGLDLFSTPFDETAVDFLLQMDVPAFKVASFEVVDVPLLRKIARTGRPIIMSTGMATRDEVEEAVRALRGEGNPRIALLKCTSAYPAPPEEMHLRTLAYLSKEFSVPAGLSDHTLGIEVPIAAAALGACIIEKHLTLSRSIPGPDSAFSLEPREFRGMVDAVRKVEKALGAVRLGPTDGEEKIRPYRPSLFVVEPVRRGESLTPRNVRSIRPGFGLHPRHWDEILGRRASCDIPAGTPLSWNLISPEVQRT